MKKLTALLTAFTLLASASTVVAADREARQPDVFVNKQLVEFADQNAYITDEGRTLVPARGVFEAMECTVDWDAENYVVTVTNEAQKKEIYLTIDNTEMKVVTDGKEVTKTLDVPATLMNDRTMIPLRAVSEALGCMVVWNPGEYSISISYTKQITAEEFAQIIQGIFNGASGDKEDKAETTVPEKKEEGDPQTVYTLSDATVSAGEEFEVELTCESKVGIKILSVAVTQYDDKIFELVGFEFDEEFKKLINAKLSNFYIERGATLALLEEQQAYGGKIGVIKFKVKDDAAAGMYEINAMSSTKAESMESVLSDVVGGNVTVKR